MVPSFAVERTQKFLFLLKELMETGQVPRVPVHADSPDGDQGSADLPEAHGRILAADQGADREIRLAAGLVEFLFRCDARRLEEDQRDRTTRSIIVSSSGMVTGGRVLHHLMLRLPDPEEPGAVHRLPGAGDARLHHQERRAEVKMFGQEVPIRAQIASLEQFSDHADTPELLEWLHTFQAGRRSRPIWFTANRLPRRSCATPWSKSCDGTCRWRAIGRRLRWSDLVSTETWRAGRASFEDCHHERTTLARGICF